jgi:hypothetical protein
VEIKKPAAFGFGFFIKILAKAWIFYTQLSQHLLRINDLVAPFEPEARINIYEE